MGLVWVRGGRGGKEQGVRRSRREGEEYRALLTSGSPRARRVSISARLASEYAIGEEDTKVR